MWLSVVVEEETTGQMRFNINALVSKTERIRLQT
jgi:hypothetical protein